MQIKLKSLHPTNFMAYHDKTFTFGDTTKISGKNGSGKSSIVNGYMWLMFDTDLELHSNPKIRREINGQPVNDMDVSVEAVFDIDGKEVTARKVQKRTFSKDKTSYKDDNTYFINEVPKTLKAFNEYFGVDMKLLQMCSNINAFLSKKDKDMREYLFSKVEDITDLDIAKKYEELAELVPLLEQYTTEEIEKSNKASIAKTNKQIPILDGQIMEKTKDVTENADIDVAELELARNGLKEKIKEIKAKQEDISKQYEEYQKLSDGVLELKFELSDLQRKSNEFNNHRRLKLEDKISDIQVEVKLASNKATIYKNNIESEKNNLKYNQEGIEQERKNYKNASSVEFNKNELICPVCRREYSEEKKKELVDSFDKNKAEKLSQITDHGNYFKAEIEKCKQNIEEYEKEKKEWEDKVFELQKSLKPLVDELEKLPQSIDISTTEEYKAIQSQIAEKEAAMQKGNSADEIRQSLNAELSEAEEQLLEVERQIAKADVSADEKRLAELKKQRMDLEQSKADCEKVLDLLAELDKKKNQCLSENINALFGIVDWKLFDFNKSGGYKSVCVPTLDGKSILDITSNKGNRILGRLDIINSIQKIEGINCPVFLDDAESLDDENIAKAVEILGCQAILLQVNNEYELKVEEVR